MQKNTYLIKNVLKEVNKYNREKEFVKNSQRNKQKLKTDVNISSLDLLNWHWKLCHNREISVEHL